MALAFPFNLKKENSDDEPMDGNQTVEWNQRFRHEEMLNERCSVLERENQTLREKMAFLRQFRKSLLFNVGTQFGDSVQEAGEKTKSLVQKEVAKAREEAEVILASKVAKSVTEATTALKMENEKLRQQLRESLKETHQLKGELEQARQVGSEEKTKLGELLAQKDRDIWSLNEVLVHSQVDNSSAMELIKKEYESLLEDHLSQWKSAMAQVKSLHASTIANMSSQFTFERNQQEKAISVLTRQVEQYAKMINGLREAQAMEKQQHSKIVSDLRVKVASLSRVVFARGTNYDQRTNTSSENWRSIGGAQNRTNILATNESEPDGLLFKKNEEMEATKSTEETLRSKHNIEIALYVQEITSAKNEVAQLRKELMDQDRKIDELERRNQFLTHQCRSFKISNEVAIAKLKMPRHNEI